MNTSIVGDNARLKKLILWLIVIAGFVLRFAYADVRPIWYDEAITIFYAKAGFSFIAQHFFQGSNPPFAYFVYYFWQSVFGTSQLSFELVSVIFGALSLYLTFRVARRLFNERTAWFSLFLICFSAYHVFVSQQIRAYSLACFLSLWSIDACADYVKNGTKRRLVGWIVTALLVCGTHFYAVFLVFSELIFLIASKSRLRNRKQLVIYPAALAGLFMLTLGLIFLIQHFKIFPIYPRPPASLTDAALVLKSILFLSKPLVAISSGLIIFCMIRLGRLKPEEQTALGFLLFWLITSTLVPFLISQWFPSFFYVRYYVFSHLAAILICAYGISLMSLRWLRVAVMTVFLSASASLVLDYYQEGIEKNREKVTYEKVERDFKDGDIILHENGWTFGPSYYYHGGRLPEYFITDEFGLPSLGKRQFSQHETLSGYKRVWFFLERPQSVELLNQWEWFRKLHKKMIFQDAAHSWFLFEIEAPK